MVLLRRARSAIARGAAGVGVVSSVTAGDGSLNLWRAAGAVVETVGAGEGSGGPRRGSREGLVMLSASSTGGNAGPDGDVAISSSPARGSGA